MTSQGKELAPGGEWPISALFFAAASIGLLAVFANLLNYQGYPPFRAEVGLVCAVLLVGAAMLSGLHRLAQPRLSFVFTGLIAALLIDLGADLPTKGFPLLAGILAAIAWFTERAVLKLTIAAFVSVLGFQTVGLLTGYGHTDSPRNEAKHLQSPRPANSSLPPVIHLMLDSYIGLDGMSAADTNFGDLRQSQERFYLAHGFQLYPDAYSRHAKTINALPEFLSYGRANHAKEPRNVQFTVAPPLVYFTDLDHLGYRTSVLTPSFVDFCPNQPLTSCHNYNRSDLATLANSSLAVTDRARVILATLLELSQFTAILSGSIDLKLAELRATHGRHFYNRAKLYSLTGMDQLDRLSHDLSSLEYGEARFVHLLIPHDPYVLDADCRVLPEPQWLDEHGPSPFAERDAAYARQARCMTDHGIKAVLDALDKTPTGRAAIVIIQGDHGSRAVDAIPGAGGPIPSPRELAVLHSAFFAVRVPGEPAGEIKGRFALDELVGALAATGFRQAPHPRAGPATVWLMDENWIPRQQLGLPTFTAKLPKN